MSLSRLRFASKALAALLAVLPAALSAQEGCGVWYEGLEVRFETADDGRRVQGTVLGWTPAAMTIQVESAEAVYPFGAIQELEGYCAIEGDYGRAKGGAVIGGILGGLAGVGLLGLASWLSQDSGNEVGGGEGFLLVAGPAVLGALLGGGIGAAVRRRGEWVLLGPPPDPEAGASASGVSLEIRPSPIAPDAWSLGFRIPLGGR